MNQISTATFGFVRKVMHIYGPIFQQDKYGTRQDFPEVNTVNNKKLCQGKLRNAFTLIQLYRGAKMRLRTLKQTARLIDSSHD